MHVIAISRAVSSSYDRFPCRCGSRLQVTLAVQRCCFVTIHCSIVTIVYCRVLAGPKLAFRMVKRWSGHTAPVTSVGFHSAVNGRLLFVSGCKDSHVIVCCLHLVCGSIMRCRLIRGGVSLYAAAVGCRCGNEPFAVLARPRHHRIWHSVHG